MEAFAEFDELRTKEVLFLTEAVQRLTGLLQQGRPADGTNPPPAAQGS